ncbi:hypothetical protein HTZ77_05040 [Nonomuraea sp. SMC257]|uniref:Uncharacterized protein n=1 Tax=Nonomuraea montanisoli TaxID=2741721 RepID=A0A7Y6I3H5_9ACTN|nr:hypothetical protein [Nonomuraea montanisoli]NUW30786.1 hypothetical protein [Nonomuraea montanisoli]
MLADEIRRPYQHPYGAPARRERPAPPPPVQAEEEHVDGATAERTVHRLHHIRQVSDLAISVIDQALAHAS